MKISQLSLVHNGALLGQNITLGDYVVVYPGARLEDGCAVGGFTQIWSGVHLRTGACLGPGVILDIFPPHTDHEAKTVFGANCTVGAGVIIYPGVSIGDGSVVVPGSVVAQNVPPYAIVSGSPARVTGYVESLPKQGAPEQWPLQTPFPIGDTITQLGVGKVSLHRFKLIRDPRGDLSVGEFHKDIPFKPKRYFLVFNVPNEKTRGEHAHRRCHQFLICVKGACSVVVDDGLSRCEVRLDSPNIGIHLPPLTWGIQYKYSPDAVLLVFTSDYYDPADYIRSYSEFTALTTVRNNKTP